jgi:hypothetical protein
MAFGGEPIEPGTFRGMDVRRNVHLLLAAHLSERAFRSQSSPMGRPKRARKYWWSTDKGVSIWIANMIVGNLLKSLIGASFPFTIGGIASNAMASPATAAKCLFQNHFAESTVPSTPQVLCEPIASACCSAFISPSASVKPERTMIMSPCLNSTPSSLATVSISLIVILCASKGLYSIPCLSAQAL